MGSLCRRTEQEGSCLQARKTAFTRNSLCTLTLDLQPPKPREYLFLLVKPLSQWCFAMEAWIKDTPEAQFPHWQDGKSQPTSCCDGYRETDTCKVSKAVLTQQAIHTRELLELLGCKQERGFWDPDWSSVWHEPRAQSGARIKHKRLWHSTGHCRREPTGAVSLQGPPALSPPGSNTHTCLRPRTLAASGGEKGNALCFKDVFVSVGGETSRFEESMAKTFLLGLWLCNGTQKEGRKYPQKGAGAPAADVQAWTATVC